MVKQSTFVICPQLLFSSFVFKRSTTLFNRRARYNYLNNKLDKSGHWPILSCSTDTIQHLLNLFKQAYDKFGIILCIELCFSLVRIFQGEKVAIPSDIWWKSYSVPCWQKPQGLLELEASWLYVHLCQRHFNNVPDCRLSTVPPRFCKEKIQDT